MKLEAYRFVLNGLFEVRQPIDIVEVALVMRQRRWTLEIPPAWIAPAESTRMLVLLVLVAVRKLAEARRTKLAAE